MTSEVPTAPAPLDNDEEGDAASFLPLFDVGRYKAWSPFFGGDVRVGIAARSPLCAAVGVATEPIKQAG